MNERTAKVGSTMMRGRAVSRRRGGILAQLMFCAVLFGVFWTDSAHAYTWMIRHGYTACGTCHADPSGGELLTEYGRVTSQLILSTQYSERDPEAEAPSPGVLWGLWEPPKGLLLGGSYRNLYVLRPDQDKVFTAIPVMQADVYGQVRVGDFTAGGSIGLGRASEGSIHGRAAQVTTNTDGINMLSRSYYLGLDIGEDVVLRAGRLNLPFGIRMPEHTTFVRQATRTDRDSDQQVGLAMSYVSDKLRLEVMGIAGNYQISGQGAAGPDDPRERGYSAFVEGIAGTSFASGVSSKVTFAKLDRITGEPDSLRQAHGLFARWAPVTPLVMLFEVDALFRSNADAGYAGFIQADVEALSGLHFMLTAEVMDQGLPVVAPPAPSPGEGQPKFGGWASIDWFFFSQMELRTDVIVRQEEPFTILGQFHTYL